MHICTSMCIYELHFIIMISVSYMHMCVCILVYVYIDHIHIYTLYSFWGFMKKSCNRSSDADQLASTYRKLDYALGNVNVGTRACRCLYILIQNIFQRICNSV